MTVFDVRKDKSQDVSKIEFFNKEDSEGHALAYAIKPCTFTGEGVELFDTIREEDQTEEGYVLISTKEHAENLIKGLNKAIELGWLV